MIFISEIQFISRVITESDYLLYVLQHVLKNDVLQSYVIVEVVIKSGVQLSLDCKTRYSSLVNMLDGFHEIRKPNKKVDVGESLDSDGEELNVESEIDAMKPVKAVV